MQLQDLILGNTRANLHVKPGVLPVNLLLVHCNSKILGHTGRLQYAYKRATCLLSTRLLVQLQYTAPAPPKRYHTELDDMPSAPAIGIDLGTSFS